MGIAYIAAYLEKHGKYEIKILDALIEGDTIDGTAIEDGEKIRYGLKKLFWSYFWVNWRWFV